MLESALEQALAGQPQVIGIVGEPGVGKSRLCDVFARRCRAKGDPRLPHLRPGARQVDPAAAGAPDHALLLRRRPSRTPTRPRASGSPASSSCSTRASPRTCRCSSTSSRSRTPSARLRAWTPRHASASCSASPSASFRAQSAREPGITLFEDLHWLDPASEAFLANHVEAAPGNAEPHDPQLPPRVPRRLDVEVLLPPDRTGSARPRGDRGAARATCSARDPSLDGLPEVVRERTARQPVLHRGGRAVAGRGGQPRGRARRLQAGTTGRGGGGAGERAGRPLRPDRPARGA